MTQAELLRLLILTNRELHIAALMSETPACKEVAHRISNPRPGDLVYESSTGRTTAVGRLVRKQKEYVPFAEEPGGYTDTFWYIEGLDGTLQRWNNCEFLRIATQDHWTLRRDDPSQEDWAVARFRRYEEEQNGTL